MFNVFSHEQKLQQQQESERRIEMAKPQSKTPQQKRRIESMVHNYKGRVCGFLKEMTSDPVVDVDKNEKVLKAASRDANKRKGPRAMHYGALRSDRERIEKAKYD